jgi:hypothetical protein
MGFRPPSPHTHTAAQRQWRARLFLHLPFPLAGQQAPASCLLSASYCKSGRDAQEGGACGQRVPTPLPGCGGPLPRPPHPAGKEQWAPTCEVDERGAGRASGKDASLCLSLLCLRHGRAKYMSVRVA